jgi:ferredoxin
MARGFIEQMPVREDCYYFAVSTHTLFGMNEFWDIDEMLSANGALLNYAAAIRMTGNVGLRNPDSRAVEQRQRSMETQVAEIAEAINNRQENYFRRSSKLLGKLVRAFTEQRRRSISFNVDERCTRCGVCAAVCPAQNISVEINGARAPIRSDKCEACLACVHWCPAGALSTATRLHQHYHHPQIRPEQLDPRSELIGAHPELIGAHPELIGAHPEQLNPRPEMINPRIENGFGSGTQDVA